MQFSDTKRKPVILFLISVLFLVQYIVLFNYELRYKQDFDNHEFVGNLNYALKTDKSMLDSLRIVVLKGSDRDLSSVDIPIIVELYDHSKITQTLKLMPKHSSTGGGQRYYHTLNYGIIDISSNTVSEIRISVDDQVNSYEKFLLKLKKDPNNVYIHLAGLSFLITLLFSIIYRESIFVNKYTKPLPYILYFFIVLLVVTWNI